ncbi:unnamed protein product [Adineta steineri]|uniref:Uncharacterized protein n=1 Tax=Adineta steineri TaxID=433720 RepID=A0A815IP60_9BILA|nr:unnamed protein product [Adineta steineri]CAF1367519.1 unnamed protein product [Adineta steineri]CAF1413022.1 unnamed protein product [Adineta steineri]CAF1602798.1 unnamed protein product [Adineta steineri]
MPIIDFCRQTISTWKIFFLNLNVFQPPVGSDQNEDEQQRRFNIIVTRIYLVLLTCLLIYLGLFTYSDVKDITEKQDNPPKIELDSFPADVECPCSRISLSYGEFISLGPILHQICKSDFVLDRWTKAIYSDSNVTYFNLNDFRTFGSAQFQALAGFCDQSISYLEQNIDSFEKSKFISPQLLPRNLFQEETQTAIIRFQQSLPRAFAAQLELILQVISSNRLMSGLQTNFIISYDDNPEVNPAIYIDRNKASCDCVSDYRCTSKAIFSDIFNASTQYDFGRKIRLPGLASGCLPVTSILASTLECFYSQTCLNTLISVFQTEENFSAMAVSNISRFGQYATVKSIVDNLMVEDWLMNVSYEKYRDNCAPLSCTYQKKMRNTLLEVMVKLIGLLSGLICALRLVLPIIVRFILNKLNNVQSPPSGLTRK